MLPERVFAKHWGHQVGNWTAWMSANQRAAGRQKKPPRGGRFGAVRGFRLRLSVSAPRQSCAQSRFFLGGQASFHYAQDLFGDFFVCLLKQ